VERPHGIDADRASRRQVAGEERDRAEYRRDNAKGQRIRRPHAIQETSHRVRRNQRTNQTDARTNDLETYALPQTIRMTSRR